MDDELETQTGQVAAIEAEYPLLAEDVRRIFGLSEGRGIETVHRYARAGKLPGIKFGRWRFRPEDVTRFLNNKRKVHQA